MPKLSQAQDAALTLLSQTDAADYFDLVKVGANGATMAWTVKKGLTVATKHGEAKRWTITNAGRAARAVGRV